MSASLAATMDETGGETWLRRRKARSLAIALGLGALVVIFYIATLVRLGPNALKRESLTGAGTGMGKTIPPNDPVICKKAGTC